jgi:hypothetical protein
MIPYPKGQGQDVLAGLMAVLHDIGIASEVLLPN